MASVASHPPAASPSGPNLRTTPRRYAHAGALLVAGWVAGAVALVIFGWLAESVLGDRTASVDQGFTAYLQQLHPPGAVEAATIVSLFGSQIVAAILAVLLIFFIVRRLWRLAAELVITTGGAQLLNDVLKNVFHRTRPDPMSTGFISSQQFSFPSGHAMVSAAFYFFLAYLAWQYLGARHGVILSAALVVLVLLIGLARLYLEAHWLSDVIAGYAAGFLWTDAVILADRVITGRSLRSHDTPPPSAFSSAGPSPAPPGAASERLRPG